MIKSPKEFTPEQRQLLSQMGISPEGRPELGMPLHSWSDNVNRVQQRMAANPMQPPLPGGTKTMDLLQLDEQKRQFNQQMGLARSKAGEGSVDKPLKLTRNDAMTSVRTLVNEAIRRGEGWHFVESRLIANAGNFDKDTMKLDEALQVAFQHYKNSAYTPTGERLPAYGAPGIDSGERFALENNFGLNQVFNQGGPIQQAVMSPTLLPPVQEDLNSPHQRLFPDQFEQGIGPFLPPPVQEEEKVAWWNPKNWFK